MHKLLMSLILLMVTSSFAATPPKLVPITNTKGKSHVDTNNTVKSIIIKFKPTAAEEKILANSSKLDKVDRIKEFKKVAKMEMDTSISTELMKKLEMAAGDGYKFTDTGAIGTGAHVLKSNKPLTTEQVKQISKVDEVKYVSLNNNLIADSAENYTDGSSLAAQWYLFGSKIGINAYDPTSKQRLFSATGKGVTIAVLDSGYGDTPSLKSQLIPYDANGNYGYTFVNDGITYNVHPGAKYQLGFGKYFHGTAVMSIIAGQTVPVQEGGNAKGPLGIAPEAKIVPVRLFPATEASAIDAMLWAVGLHPTIDNANPAKVLNMSFSVTSPNIFMNNDCKIDTPALYDTFSLLEEANAIPVVATGNSPLPASYEVMTSCPGIITVTATNSINGGVATWATVGPTVSIAAPGEQISVTRIGPDGSFSVAKETGTSYAAPVVTGIIADMLSVNPNLTSSQIRQIIQETAIPFTTEQNKCRGGTGTDCMINGRINAAAAVKRAEALN